ncbi:hypothetical protein AC028_19165 [Xanthomonas citri pv. aurantifolii]|nr:hypothetical protein AC028_19165 [Xanthomonas citri pv. aurantifolii]ARE57084.1 hypothetical protein TP45_12585 [Xanthomonas citri pv. aurantifolii]
MTVLSFVACPLSIGINIDAHTIAAYDGIRGVVGLEDRDSTLVALQFFLDGRELAAVIAQHGPADE